MQKEKRERRTLENDWKMTDKKKRKT